MDKQGQVLRERESNDDRFFSLFSKNPVRSPYVPLAVLHSKGGKRNKFLLLPSSILSPALTLNQLSPFGTEDACGKGQEMGKN